jgi:hypothetical protein
MQSPRIPARIVAQDSEYFVSVWHDTVITLFRGPCSLQHALTISDTCRAVLAESRGAATYLGVIERESPAPSDIVRRELASWSRDVVSQMKLAVIVAEGGGFKNALVRGVGVALTVLVPHQVPFKITSTVEEGVAALAPLLSRTTGGVTELSLAVSEVRRRWPMQRPPMQRPPV